MREEFFDVHCVQLEIWLDRLSKMRSKVIPSNLRDRILTRGIESETGRFRLHLILA
jgi:hypothetical protein